MQPQPPITLWHRLRSLLGLTADGPWRAKTAWLAALVLLLGLGFWLHAVITIHPPEGPDGPTFNELGQRTSGTQFDWSRPMPGAVKIAVSYLAAFFIGWTFRRFIVMAAAIALLVLSVLLLGKFAGWDTSTAQQQVKQGAELVQREAVGLKAHAQNLLPSTTAAGVGAFLGFRRRHRFSTPSPVQS